jgi:hypothetical protein
VDPLERRRERLGDLDPDLRDEIVPALVARARR